MKCRGGGCGGGGDDHDDGSNALSRNNNDDGAEEEEAAVDIVEDEGEDFATGLTSICWDHATTMMGTPVPLLTRPPLPLQGLPLQRDDRTAGAKNACAIYSTVASTH